MYKKIFCLIILLFFLTGCGTTYQEPVEELSEEIQNGVDEIGQVQDLGNLITFSNKHFKLMLPDNWKENKITENMFVYMRDDVENLESINIIVAHIGKDAAYDLKELLDQGIELNKKTMNDLKITQESSEILFGSIKGYKIQYTVIIENKKTEFNQIMAIGFDKLYTMTYNCYYKECDSHDVYEHIIKTFKPINS